jgi:hypothetical protein
MAREDAPSSSDAAPAAADTRRGPPSLAYLLVPFQPWRAAAIKLPALDFSS